VKFWDSSALVPLLVEEPASARLAALLKQEGEFAVWWGAPVECASAIARREREGHLPLAEAQSALTRLRLLQRSWIEISPSDRVRDLALRLLRSYSLRASDSLQLAAAHVAADEAPESLGVVCLDERLAAAAQRAGFPLTAGLSHLADI
jgi:predicted nucleic acid-binding protein